MKRLNKTLLPLSLLIIAAGGAGPAEATLLPAYAGAWDCGVGTFTFTRNTYDSGEGPMTAERVEVDGGSYHFIFADGYSFWITVSGTEMQWLSDATGDSFACTRVAK